MNKGQILLCCLLQLTIVMSATTSINGILTDTTPMSTTTTSNSGVLTDTTPMSTTPMQFVYNGQVYNVGDTFTTNDDCGICWCLNPQMICRMCSAQPSTSATSSTISPDTTTTTTSATTRTSTTILPGQCVYNGKIYNDGDFFITKDYCQNYCWCIDSQMICTMCPLSTSKSTTSSTKSSTTTTTTAPPTSTTISPDITTTTTSTTTRTSTTPRQCVYNGKIYTEGAFFIANDFCQNYCWCIDSQIICTMCPPSTSTPTISSTKSSTTTATTTPPSSTTISPEIYTTTDTETKRRRRTLPPALSKKTKKVHTDLFHTITKKPHFTIHGSHESGSKRSTMPKNNA